MKQYSIFHPLVMAFYSKSLYQDVCRHWRGTGFLYLLVLLALLWVPTMFQAYRKTNAIIHEILPTLLKDFPTISMKGGRLSIDKPVPYVIKGDDPDAKGTSLKSEKIFAIIDTSGQYTSLDGVDAVVLATHDKLFIRDKRKIEVYEFKNWKDFVVDEQLISSLVDKVQNTWVFVVYPLAVLVTFLLRMIQVIFYAVIGLIFNALVKANLDYLSIMRLTSIALTPVIFFTAASYIFGIQFSVGFLWWVALSLAYLFYAIYVNKPEFNPVAQ